MTLRNKILVIILEISLIPLLLFGFVGYSNSRQQITHNTFTKLDTLAQIQKNRLQKNVQNKLDLIELFTSKPVLRTTLRNYNVKPDPAWQTSMYENLQEVKASVPRIKDILIANPAGIIVAATDESLLGTDVSAENFFRSGLRHEDVSTIKKDNASSLLLNYLAGPLVLDGQTLGVAVLVTDSKDFVDPTQNYTGLGKTGEILLVKKNAQGDVVFIFPTRSDPDAAFNVVVPKENTDVPSVHAVAGEERTFSNAVDYHHVKVFAATRFVKALDWGIVVKIDRAEALAPVKKLQTLFVFLITVTALIVVFIGIAIARSFISPLERLIPVVNSMAKGDLSQRVVITSRDEIGALSKAFNSMAEKLSDSSMMLEQRVYRRTRELKNSQVATQNVLEDLHIEKENVEMERVKEEAILLSVGDGLIATDEKGSITLMNQTGGKLLGTNSKAMIGKYFADAIRLEDERGTVIPPEKRPIHLVLATKSMTTVTGSNYYYVRKDKSKFPVAMTVRPIILDGKVIGAIEVFRDITKEKEIDKAKTEFISLTSHQLRTPLSAVNWFAEMLLEGDAGKVTKQQRKYLDEIYAGNQRMIDLVNALLNVSRIELGTFMVDPEPIDVGKLLESVVKEQQFVIAHKELQCTIDVSPEVGRMQLDPQLTRIVFQNLLSNAVKYTPEKGIITITMKVCKAGSKVQHRVMIVDSLSIAIHDTGYGIPKDQESQIFTKLFRADNVKAKDTDGTGLGLYIVKSIVEQSGGAIWFTSKENAGTTFFVTLPLSGMVRKAGTKAIDAPQQHTS